MATTINNTMTKIQTVTVGSGGASSIDFTSIPQTYTDLVIVHSLRFNSSNITLKLEYNGSTTSYTRRQLVGDGSSASSYNGSDAFIGYISGSTYTANTFGNGTIYIPNYTSSNYKSASSDSVSENNSTTAVATLAAQLWSNTSAITSIKLSDYAGTASFVQYSTATLYGITATPNTTKASGGIIYQDATYMYHVFPYSSTFTPSTNLTVDYLVIAGGGGGGVGEDSNQAQGGGGGGAGGLRSTVGATGGGGSLESQLLLTANTGYTVTIGAGGTGSSNTANVGTSGSNSVFSTITSNGGGGGAGKNANGASGGSGGGAGAGPNNAQSGGSVSPSGQGYAGGNGRKDAKSGGGGGAGGAGQDASAIDNGLGGAGGVGAIITAFATATNTGQIVSGVGYYAGGGAGGSIYGPTPLGGFGGGGKGSASNTPTAGTVNTGGGGGGSCYVSIANGANGGSGLVVVRYAK